MSAQTELDRLKDELAGILEIMPAPLQGSYANMNDILAGLRLRVKYLMFDIEATRRENSYLREMLNNDKSSGGMHQPV